MIYLACLLGAAAGLAALDRRFRLFFWHAPRSAVVVLAAGVGFFLAWDGAGIAAGVFEHGASPLTTGIMLAPELPLEEPVFLAFFCYAAMLLFTGAERALGRRTTTRAAGARRADAGRGGREGPS